MAISSLRNVPVLASMENCIYFDFLSNTFDLNRDPSQSNQFWGIVFLLGCWVSRLSRALPLHGQVSCDIYTLLRHGCGSCGTWNGWIFFNSRYASGGFVCACRRIRWLAKRVKQTVMSWPAAINTTFSITTTRRNFAGVWKTPRAQSLILSYHQYAVTWISRTSRSHGLQSCKVDWLRDLLTSLPVSPLLNAPQTSFYLV